MKKVISLFSLPLVTAVALASGWSATSFTIAAAGEREEHESRFVCTNATLKGLYGFALSGTRPAAPGGPSVAVVGTALTTFFGDGTLAQVDTIHIDADVPIEVDRPGIGTYTLNEDCSGSMTLTSGGRTLNLTIVVVDRGREVRTAVLNPRVMVTSNGRRI